MAWQIDGSHTRAGFSVRHLMISNVHGFFDKVNGTVDFNEENPAASSINVEIETGSIQTRDEKRDAHLKSGDFFDVEKYPAMTFKSKAVEVLEPGRARVTGDLTIRDVTKEVVLDVEHNGTAKAPWGTTNAGFTATGKVNRKDFGLNWNMALETGGVLVGDEVKLQIEAEIIKQ